LLAEFSRDDREGIPGLGLFVSGARSRRETAGAVAAAARFLNDGIDPGRDFRG
jgi:hypothetical protein